MANYFGTTGIDVFGGQPFTVNEYFFEAGEYSTLDVIVGANGGDYIHFLAPELRGSSGTVLFLGVTGVDRLYFSAGSDVIIPNALVVNASSTDPFKFTCHGSDEVDVFDISAVTAAQPVWLNGEGGADEFIGGGEGSKYQGGDGNDDFHLSGGTEIVEGGDDNDDIFGSAADLDGDTIDGGSGSDDIILASAGSFAITMEHIESVLLVNGANTVTISSFKRSGGSDLICHIEGGSGADTIVIESEDTVFAAHTYENFLIETNGGNDIVTGGAGNDTIDGGADVDALGGGAGTDTLIGGAGDDLLSGGSGDDLYVDVGAGDLVNELLTTGTDTIQTAVAVFGMAVNIEILDYTGSADATLTGNASGNTITAGAGSDTIEGGDGNDTLKGFGSGDVLKGEAGDDTLFGADGIDTVRGGAGDDTLYGGRGGDTLSGGGNADTLFGGDHSDILEGGDGDDVLTGGNGADELNGGRGSDTASYEESTIAVDADLKRRSDQVTHGEDVEQLSGIENLIGGSGDDSLRGTAGDNVLIGNGGFDTLQGRDGNDTLTGGEGDDILLPGGGDDIVDGGAGYDTADYSFSTTFITVLYVFPGTLSLNGTDAGNDTLTSIEAFIGGSGNDSFFYISDATGNNGDDKFYATSAADRLDGGEGVDTVVYGDPFPAVQYLTVDLEDPARNREAAAGDTLTSIENLSYIGALGANLFGTAERNVFVTGGQLSFTDGRGGDDVVFANGVSDIIDGGTGVDTVDYSEATEAVRVIQNPLDGVLIGEDGAVGDIIIGCEAIVGSDFADTISALDITADAPGFTLHGGDGADTLTTGDGDDVISGGSGADTIDGGGGADTVDYSASNAGVTLAFNNGVAEGGDGEGDTVANMEHFIGSGFDDVFTGDSGFNILQGGGGNDRLSGGNGQDELTGGLGDDNFRFTGVTHSEQGADARDIITDFAQEAGNDDVVDLSVIDAIESTGAEDSFTFVGEENFSAEGQVRVTQNGADAIIHVNTSGTGGAEMQIELLNFTAANITAADFLL